MISWKLIMSKWIIHWIFCFLNKAIRVDIHCKRRLKIHCKRNLMIIEAFYIKQFQSSHNLTLYYLTVFYRIPRHGITSKFLLEHHRFSSNSTQYSLEQKHRKTYLQWTPWKLIRNWSKALGTRITRESFYTLSERPIKT